MSLFHMHTLDGFVQETPEVDQSRPPTVSGIANNRVARQISPSRDSIADRDEDGESESDQDEGDEEEDDSEEDEEDDEGQDQALIEDEQPGVGQLAISFSPSEYERIVRQVRLSDPVDIDLPRDRFQSGITIYFNYDQGDLGVEEELMPDPPSPEISFWGAEPRFLHFFPDVKPAPIVKIPVSSLPSPFVPFDCAVCYEVCENRLDISTLNCNHKFHSACIIRWTDKVPRCPLCRHPVTEVVQYEEADAETTPRPAGPAPELELPEDDDDAVDDDVFDDLDDDSYLGGEDSLGAIIMPGQRDLRENRVHAPTLAIDRPRSVSRERPALDDRVRSINHYAEF